MEELNKLVEQVRKFDGEGDYESAHGSEDQLMYRALKLIVEGVDDPVAVARIALSTDDADSVRWYA